MTENAAYPVFLFAVWLIARTVRRPSLGNQALAFVGLGVMAFTRIQGLALLGAYITAAVIYAWTGHGAARVAYLRRFLPTWAVAVAATLAPFVLAVLRGEGALNWLGSRSETFDAFHAREVPEWLAYLAGDLLLYVAIVPALATGVVIGLGCRRRASEQLRLFSALGLSVFGAMLVQASLPARHSTSTDTKTSTSVTSSTSYRSCSSGSRSGSARACQGRVSLRR